MSPITIRILHRYLGFFLAGIMLIYALSGIVLIYRTTDTFKSSQYIETTIEPNLSENELGQQLRIKRFKVDQEDDTFLHFRLGTYNKLTGELNYTKMELPYLLDKLNHLHKATTDSPVYWLNIFFAVALLFFSLSTFWMFKPKSKTFRSGVRYTVAGIILALTMLFIQ